MKRERRLDRYNWEFRDAGERLFIDSRTSVKAPEPLEYFTPISVSGLQDIVEGIISGEVNLTQLKIMAQDLLKSYLIDKHFYSAIALNPARKYMAFLSALREVIVNLAIRASIKFSKELSGEYVDSTEWFRRLMEFLNIMNEAIEIIVASYAGGLILNKPEQSYLAMSKFGLLPEKRSRRRKWL